MGDVKGVNIERKDYKPRSGTDTGVFLIQLHEGVALTGTVDGISKEFTFPSYLPIGDINCDGIVDAKDITVYVNGVEAAVTSFDPLTRKATLTTAPADEAIVTGDIGELHEAISLQDWNQANKPKEIKWDEARSSDEITIYTGTDDTLQINMKTVSPKLLSICFDPETNEKLDTPPVVAFAIVHFARNNNEKDWAYYCENASLVLSTGEKGKALDITDMTMDLALNDKLRLAKSIDTGYLLDAGIASA